MPTPTASRPRRSPLPPQRGPPRAAPVVRVAGAAVDAVPVRPKLSWRFGRPSGIAPASSSPARRAPCNLHNRSRRATSPCTAAAGKADVLDVHGTPSSGGSSPPAPAAAMRGRPRRLLARRGEAVHHQRVDTRRSRAEPLYVGLHHSRELSPPRAWRRPARAPSAPSAAGAGSIAIAGRPALPPRLSRSAPPMRLTRAPCALLMLVRALVLVDRCSTRRSRAVPRYTDELDCPSRRGVLTAAYRTAAARLAAERLDRAEGRREATVLNRLTLCRLSGVSDWRERVLLDAARCVKAWAAGVVGRRARVARAAGRRTAGELSAAFRRRRGGRALVRCSGGSPTRQPRAAFGAVAPPRRHARPDLRCVPRVDIARAQGARRQATGR